MKKKSIVILATSALLMSAQTIQSQGNIEDYKRAFGIRGKYSNKVIGNITPNVYRNDSKKDTHFWYSTFNGDSTIYYDVNKATGEKTLLPGHPIPPRKPTASKGRQRHWMEVPDEKEGQSHKQGVAGKDEYLFHKDNNLYLKNKQRDTETQITFDGTDSCYYSIWGTWSPDNKYYATVKIKPAPKRYVTYTLSSPRHRLQPVYSQQEYAKPGDSLNYRIPVVIDMENKKVIEPSTALFHSQYYVTRPEWDKNGKTLTFEFNERGHKHFRILEMDLKGNVRTLIEEANDKYVAYSRNLRRNFDGGNKILWKSDRDGHAHLYIYDRKTEKLTQVTKGDFWVRDVQHIDYEEGKKKGTIYFSANGMGYKNMGTVQSSFDGVIPQEDPYHVHYYRIDTNGKNLVCLTPEKGNHKATYSNDFTTLIDTYSSVDQAPIAVLRNAKNGKVISTLETADISRLEQNGWKAPEVFVAPGRDGKTDMWGIIQRPSNFDPNKKYPVIEYIYSGPGDQYVPKTFTPWLWNLADLAELGFIVVQLDAMTTSFRSLDFEQVCYKNLKDAGFPDRIEWIKAAAEKYPYMDIENMGIYGCSAGGQEALAALLFHGDFYKVAYSACGCHDNRMDKIWWNEQWMGYPVDSSYVASSNVEHAKNLKGKLMLVVGEMDDNVDPSSTYQVVNALQQAGKDFEFILLPGARHTMGERFGEHKRYDFFVKHLMKTTPPEWDDLK